MVNKQREGAASIKPWPKQADRSQEKVFHYNMCIIYDYIMHILAWPQHQGTLSAIFKIDISGNLVLTFSHLACTNKNNITGKSAKSALKRTNRAGLACQTRAIVCVPHDMQGYINLMPRNNLSVQDSQEIRLRILIFLFFFVFIDEIILFLF